MFCGLTGIVWLHRKIQDAFFLVIGSRTCAHLLQSAAGVMIFAEPRFATAILEEKDLAGLADANEEIDRVVARLLARRPEIKTLFLVGSCPSEVIKLDLSRAAMRSERDARGRECPQLLRQRHRDDVHPGRRHLPRGDGAGAARVVHAESELLVVGTLPDVVEDQFQRILRCPLDPGSVLPAASLERATAGRAGAPAISSRSRFSRRPPTRSRSVAQPVSRLRSRSGSRAPGDGLRPRQRRSASRRARLEEVVAPGRGAGSRSARSNEGASRRTGASSSSRTRSSRFRSLASCTASSTWSWSRLAPRSCSATTSRTELAMLPPTVTVSEGQDVEKQLDRCRAEKPDMVVCGLGLANPLEAEGMTTKWSIELVFTPIQGYEQAADLAELFARPLVRREPAGGLTRCSCRSGPTRGLRTSARCASRRR